MAVRPSWLNPTYNAQCQDTTPWSDTKKVGNLIEALCDFVRPIVAVEVVVCEGCPLNFCVSSCSRRECP